MKKIAPEPSFYICNYIPLLIYLSNHHLRTFCPVQFPSEM
jgi:hypothetical protein